MDSMATVFKKIDRATRKGKIDDKEDLVAAAKQLKESFIKSKNLIPPMVADMLDGDDKTKMIAEYKKAIDESISLCDKLIKNLEEEDVAAAKATIKELKKGRRSGHDKYQPEDE